MLKLFKTDVSLPQMCTGIGHGGRRGMYPHNSEKNKFWAIIV